MSYYDIPGSYIALAQWSACLVLQLACTGRKKNSLSQSVAAAALFLSALLAWFAAVGLLAAGQSGTGETAIMAGSPAAFLLQDSTVYQAPFPHYFLWLSLQRLGSWAGMALYLWYVLDQNGRGIAFLTQKSILLSEFAAAFAWQIEILALCIRTPVAYTRERHAQLVPEQAFLPVPFRVLILAGVYALVFLVSWLAERGVWRSGPGSQNEPQDIRLNITRKDLAEATLIAVFCFVCGNNAVVFSNEIYKIWDVVFPISVRALLLLAGTIILLFLQQKIREIQMAAELSQMQFQLREQYDKYRNYQDSMDLINIKYHDLKHQIAGLRAQLSDQDKEQWIRSMEKELDRYQPEFQTGSPVLDTLLSGKQASLQRQKIQLTVVADGSLLSFLHVTDLCTIFGNALDNAMESAAMVQDPDKRVIHLVVTRKNDFLFISCENYCAQEPRIVDGLPQTSKKDWRDHGFGTRSIRQTVWKYHGNATFRVQAHQFMLHILIPIPEA